MADTPNSVDEPGRKWKEIKIPVPWGHICGKWWGPPVPQPILALHGWQDNLGTWDKLIPLLPADLPILAIDLPGHGFSSKYPKGQVYYIFWDFAVTVRRIVKYFGFKSLTIMGHSLGGIIGFMYASIYPDDVYKLIQIDIANPTVRPASQIVNTSGEIIDKFLRYEELVEGNQPCYDIEDMLEIVIDGYNGSVNRESCKVLLKRGMIKAPNGNGFVFTRDVRLKVAGLGLMSLEQVLEFAGKIRCKLLNIRALPYNSFDNAEYYTQVMDTIKQNAEVEYHEVAGTHHLHLNTPERISEIVSNFLLSP